MLKRRLTSLILASLSLWAGSLSAVPDSSADQRQRGIDSASRALHFEMPHGTAQHVGAEAIQLLEPFVLKHDAEACWYVGYLTSIGRGTPANDVKARSLMRCAADGGNPSAAFWLAGALEGDLAAAPHGTGHDRKMAEVRRYLQIAIDHGHAGAALMLANLPPDSNAPAIVDNGKSQPSTRIHHEPAFAPHDTPAVSRKDLVAFTQCIGSTPGGLSASEVDALNAKLAAAQAQVRELQAKLERQETERTLAQTRWNVQGITALNAGDYTTAAAKFRLGVDAFEPAAMTNLGVLYLNGQGVSQDPGAAYALFYRAQDAGDPIAAENLGRVYGDGIGIPPDQRRAADWRRRAQELWRLHDEAQRSSTP